jgi:hypothetical protein
VQAFVEARTPPSRPGPASRADSELEEQRASPSITNLSNLSNFHRILSYNGLSGRAVINSERFVSSPGQPFLSKSHVPEGGTPAARATLQPSVLEQDG